MRTSKENIERSYLKQYIEPDLDLITNVSATKETDIIIDNDNIENVPCNDDTHTRKLKNFNRWYEKDENKQTHLARVKSHSVKKSTYQKRILRELNSAKMDFNKLKQNTIDYYGIKIKEGVYYTDKEITD